MPVDPVYNIKNVYLNGEKITYSKLLSDHDTFLRFKHNILAFDDSDFTRTMVEEKTEELFRQMDIKYYGEGNDIKGTLSPTEKFYIRLKIFNYIAIYEDYDFINEYKCMEGTFLLGGRTRCEGYAVLTHYLLTCAGLEAKTYYSDPEGVGVHFWNISIIGREWFESDDSWSAQYKSYGSILGSTPNIECSELHKFELSYDTYHLDSKSESTKPTIAERTLGDINDDDKRNKEDVEMLWDYIKGETSSIDAKAPDINFDGNIDIDDAVVLISYINGNSTF